MKSSIKFLSTVLFGIMLVGFTANGYAQDLASATETYNQAREYAQQGNFDEAIAMYEEALSAAESLGEDGEDIVTRSERAIPSMYFEKAKAVFGENQQNPDPEAFDRIIAAFTEAQEAADEYGNEQLSTQSGQIVTQMHYNKAVNLFRNESYDASMQAVNTAIERNANYAKAHYLRARLLRDQEGHSLEDIVSAYDEAIQIAEQANDSETARAANNSIAAELIRRGYEESEASDFQDAIELYNRALNYMPESTEANYRLAEVNNKMAEWNQALEYANRALELEDGGRTDQAKIYFEIGLAQQGLGNDQAACSAFTNAAYGDFAGSAEHKMEHELECGETD